MCSFLGVYTLLPQLVVLALQGALASSGQIDPA